MGEEEKSDRINDTERKTVSCRTCGAEFDATMPNCPYCGTMYLPAAETAYMNKLEGIRGDLAGLGALRKKETRAHAGRLSKKLLTAAAILLLAVAAVLVVRLIRERKEAALEQAEYLWQREGFARMDEFYDAGAYKDLVAFYDQAADEGHRVWQYRHRSFCEYYDLILAAQSSLQAGEAGGRLIEENSGLIWSVARRFFGRGTDPEDLFQLGCVGFLKAVEGYDESFGTQFSTYAVPKISGEIRRFLRDDGAVKVSRSLKEQANHLRSARVALEQRLGREPTIGELSAETGIAPEDIAFAETAAGPTESLQRETNDDGFTLEHVLGDYQAEDKMLERVALRSAIDRLPERERQVIALRYFHGLTQQNCARVLHVSQVQISRLERRAVERMREWMD